MIISKEILVGISSSNMNYYKNLGYDAKYHEKILIKVEDLSKGSHAKIIVQCDYCNKKYEIEYKTHLYNNKIIDKTCCSNQNCINNKIIDASISKNPMQSHISKENLKKTCINLYGVDSFMKTKKFTEKTKDTNFKKYGYDHHFKSPEFQEKQKIFRIDNNIQVSDEKLTQYEIYKKIVRSLTQKTKKQLFKDWDGFDYYDNEYIKECILKNKPSVDHKISIIYGFINNISPEKISDISNLCITKLVTNLQKNRKCENEFTLI